MSNPGPAVLEQDLKDLLVDHSGDAPPHRIVRVLRARGSLSATEISSLTGLAKSTVSTALVELRRSGLVVDAKVATGQRAARAGRPATALTLNPRAGICVGVMIGLNKIQVIVADVSHNVLADKTVNLEPDYTPAEALRIVKRLIAASIEENGLRPESVVGVGIAIAGPVNPRSGQIHKAGGVPTWAGVDIRRLFEKSLHYPVFADNESNCSAVAQMMWGAALGRSDFVFVTLDIGVGGAIVSDGRVVVGAAGGAGEFGHVSIDPHGPVCRCGNRGCLERYVADPLIALERDPARPLPILALVKLAGSGDAFALGVITKAATIAGRGLAILGTVLNPELFVIGGELALAGDLLLKPLRESYEQHTLIKRSDGLAGGTEFVVADFIENEACLGAVGLVLRHQGTLEQIPQSA